MMSPVVRLYTVWMMITIFYMHWVLCRSGIADTILVVMPLDCHTTCFVGTLGCPTDAHDQHPPCTDNTRQFISVTIAA